MERLEKEKSTEITNRHRKRANIREVEDEREKKMGGVGGKREITPGSTKQQLRKRKFKVRTMWTTERSFTTWLETAVCMKPKVKGKSNQSLCGDSNDCIVYDPRITFWNRNKSNNTRRQYICHSTVFISLSNCLSEIYAELNRSEAYFPINVCAFVNCNCTNIL